MTILPVPTRSAIGAPTIFQEWFRRHRLKIALLLGAGSAVLVAQTIYVSLYAASLPYWDQWQADILRLFKPLLTHPPTMEMLFASHNGHRILFTRQVSIMLWHINGGVFDNRVECYTNILLLLAIFATFTLALQSRTRSPVARIVAPCLLAAICCMPIEWENALVGFQNSFYWLVLGMLGAFVLLTRRRFTWREWLPASMFAFASLFTMAAGVFTALIATALACWRSLRGSPRSVPWQALPFALVTLFGIVIQPHLAGGATMPAIGAQGNAQVLMRALGWPATRPNGPLFIVAWLPLLLSIPGLHRRLHDDHGTCFVLAMAVWSLLIAMAIAATRTYVAPRYAIVLAPAVLANAVLACELPASRSKIAVAVLFACYVGISFAGRTGRDVREMWDRYAYSQIETQRLVLFLRRHDSAVLHGPTPLQIPFYEAAILESMLLDPQVAGMLAPPLNPRNAEAPLTHLVRQIRNAVLHSVGAREGQWTPSVLRPDALPVPERPAESCSVDFINDGRAGVVNLLGYGKPLALTGRMRKRAGRQPHLVSVQLRGNGDYELTAVSGLAKAGYVTIADQPPPPGRYALFVVAQSRDGNFGCNTNQWLVVQ